MPPDALPLARVTPARRATVAAAPPPVAAPQPAPRKLNPRQKAAVIVRFLMAEGARLPLSDLPEQVQAALAEQMAALRLIDRATLDHVVGEFVSELESVGLAFPGGIEGALSIMDGHISQSAASRLRRKAGVSAKGDPWDRLTALPPDRLLPVIDAESVEVAAVILSKLPVARAADLLGLMPGERARRIAFAVSQTGNIDPETVRRIGAAILCQIDSQPARAFDRGPEERVGAILNVSPATTRDEVLRGLEAEDAGFAEKVRKAIFTFAHIAQRLLPRDVPKVVRLVDQPVLVTALAHARSQPALDASAEFLLANMSQRLSQALREDVADRGRVREKDGEAALNAVIGAIRGLEAAGEIALIQPEEDG